MDFSLIVTVGPSILDKEKLSLPITVFLMITVRNHNEIWIKKFKEILKNNKKKDLNANFYNQFKLNDSNILNPVNW